MKVVDRFLERPLDARAAVMVILFVSAGRLLLESGLLQGDGEPGTQWLREATKHLTFYTYVFLSFTAVLTLALGTRPGQAAKAVAVGLMAAFVAPVADLVLTPGVARSYGYFDHPTLTLFGHGQPVSESISLWMAIGGAGIFAGVVRRSAGAGFFGLVAGYVAMQVFLLSLWVTEVVAGQRFLFFAGAVPFTLSVLLFFALRARDLAPSLARINHTLPFAALAACGMAWSGGTLSKSWERLLLPAFLFGMAIIQNDHWDRREDQLGGRRSGATADDAVWATYLAALAAVLFLRGGGTLTTLALLFMLAALLYHHPSFRLKERFCLAYKIEGLWVLLSFLIGYTHRSSFHGESIGLVALVLFAGGALVSVPKDYKDVASDRAAGIPTYYVLLTRRGLTEARAHRLIVATQTLALLLPVVYFTAVGGLDAWTLALALAALGPAALLLAVPHRRWAVETMLVALSGYLVLAAVVIARTVG